MTIQDKTRELIEAGREEVVLDEARLERNRARILSCAVGVAVVGAGAAAAGSASAAATGAGGAAGTAAATKAVATFSLAKLALAVAVVGGTLAGSYAVVTRAPEPAPAPAERTAAKERPTPSAAVPQPPAVPKQVKQSTLAEDEAPKADASHAPVLAGSANKPRAGASSLSEHADLLREARAALATGNAARALSLLDAHHEVARGALGPEWSAARILVLCRLGRIGEAKQLAARFLKSHASSPLAAQVAASCAGE